MIRYVLALVFVGISYAQNAFQSLEGVVGYIVVEKGGRVENYLVIEDKGGSVKTVKVDKKPSNFLKKTEEGGRR
ncbi:MAG: hypothetical protein ACK4ZR_03945 [Aquificaceae bacterium]